MPKRGDRFGGLGYTSRGRAPSASPQELARRELVKLGSERRVPLSERLAASKARIDGEKREARAAVGSSSLSERLAEKVYAESERTKSRGTRFGKVIAAAGVQKTAEFRRILDLPRRKWEDGAAEIAGALTESLRLPGCEGHDPAADLCSVCRCPLRLRPAQGAAVRDAHDVRGLLAPIPVGGGKALVSLLIPVVLDCERPILLVPSALRDQTLRKVLPMVRRHWRMHPALKVVGHSEMSTVKNADMLETLRPDLIVLDESHAYKNLKAARTRRLQRWMREHPNTMLCAMSGTITRKSLRDYWHVLLWALKPDLAPIPARWRELQDWADALDVLPDEASRVPPGALRHLCETRTVLDPVKGSLFVVETAREGYARRLAETPGVVAVREADVTCSLVLSERALRPDAATAAHLAKLQRDWELPNGDLVTEAVDLWRHAREIALGFFYRWDPAPPPDWMAARRAWKKFVRDTITTNRRGLDTELQVWRECAARPAAPAEFLDWRAVKDSFEPNTVPEWFSLAAVEDAARWLAEGPGICWVEHQAFGLKLAEVSGRRCYGAGDDAIVDAAPGEAIVASIRAHGTGKNLQHFSRNLVASCPPSGATWEQLLGRTHRSGQEADEVTAEVYLGTDALREALVRSVADARYIESTTGNRQKLLYADCTIDGIR